MSTSTSRKRTVFNLTPQELHTLRKLNINVSATVPPRRPSRVGGQSEYAYDLGIYDRYRELHERAKYERSIWLREQRITRAVVAQAVLAQYNPYANASRLGVDAPPPTPAGYEQEWQMLFTPKPKLSPKPSSVVIEHFLGGVKGFSI
jgi:hypothetical protein